MVAQFITSAKKLSLSGLSEVFFVAASAGGRALLEAPANAIETKSDGSPVTRADLASDAAIRVILSHHFPDWPIISEEHEAELPQGHGDKPFILVDPMDGTKEYISGHSDYAICIGLIVAKRPVAGVILAPAQKMAWLGYMQGGGFGQADEVILDDNLEEKTGARKHLKLTNQKTLPTSVITSRSHSDMQSTKLISRFPGIRHVTMGAALKFTSIARGDACLYPRGMGSMEWDTAAGEAILMAAGGHMVTPDGLPLTYGKIDQHFRNRSFIAGCNKDIVQTALAQWAAC
jgi:3'(2'), 5'-bisphosphate nucleotidase